MAAQLGEMLDTSPDERARYFAMLARLTRADRARKVAALSRATRDLARAGIRLSRPDATAAEIELELVARLYGPAIAGKLAPYLAVSGWRTTSTQ